MDNDGGGYSPTRFQVTVDGRALTPIYHSDKEAQERAAQELAKCPSCDIEIIALG